MDRILRAWGRSRDFVTWNGALKKYDDVEGILLVCRNGKILTVETAFWKEIK